MKILAAPANYIFSDKIGSEPLWSFKILEKLGLRGIDVTAIVGVADLSSPLPPEVKLLITQKYRSENAFREGLKKLKFTYQYYQLARQVLRKEKIDIIHHILPFSPGSYNILAMRNQTRPYPFIIGPVAFPIQTKRYEDFRFCLGVRDGLSSKLLYKFLEGGNRIWHHLFRRTIERADRLICDSQLSKGYYEQYFPSPKIIVIPTGIEIESLPDKKQPADHKVTILTVSYLTVRKDIPALLYALKRIIKKHPNVELKIAGHGPQENELRRLTKELGLGDKVNFLGFIKHSHISKAYQSADIFCLTSVEDPNPLVIKEAMSYGLPVIATEVGAVKEYVDSSTGIIVPLRDVTKFAQSLDYLLSNEELRLEMGKRARERAEKRYSWNRIIDQYITLYQDVLKEKRGQTIE